MKTRRRTDGKEKGENNEVNYDDDQQYDNSHGDKLMKVKKMNRDISGYLSEIYNNPRLRS